MKLTIKITKEIIERASTCGIRETASHMLLLQELTGIPVHPAKAMDLSNLTRLQAREVEESKQRWCDVVSSKCLITEAVKDLWPAHTANIEIEWLNREGRCIAFSQLPGIARQLIVDFDLSTVEQRLLMKPTSFEIEFPDKLVDIIGLLQIQEVLSQSTTLELVG